MKKIQKRGTSKESKSKKKNNFPVLEHLNFRIPRTFGQKAADALTKWAGSWAFIISLFIFLTIWILLNVYFLIQHQIGQPFDPYPFILLNLILSCLAAVQAPIILMSQNRTSQRDRLKAEYDHAINRSAEKEIREVKALLLNRRRRK